MYVYYDIYIYMCVFILVLFTHATFLGRPGGSSQWISADIAKSLGCSDALTNCIYIYMVNISEYTVKAMAITYNWLFLWDYTFYQWGDLLVLITGISGHSYKYL